MMFEFDTECQDLNHFMNMNDELKDLSYFIKKDLYNENNEYYYNEEYKIKDLLKICQYYGIASSVKAAKCKKQDIVSTIVYFESLPENYKIVEKRHKMWAFITELLEDPKMKSYLIW
jgi:Zn-dependent peptidase ImmA (M78 family)